MSSLYLRFAAGGADPLRRAPLVERLLARASASTRVVDWRAEAFSTVAAEGEPVPAIGPSLYAAKGEVPGAWICVATPVHLVAGMTHVTMPQDGCLDLDSHEAEALAADFNNVFIDAGARLSVGGGAILLCVLDQALGVVMRDPADAAGRDVFDFQALGIDAPRLRRLMSEMEMWLFDHSVNRARTARGQLPVTGLWLWGGGAALSAAPAINGWTAGRDPLFAACHVVTEFPSDGGPGVVVSAARPGSAEWLDVEERWLRPAIRALKTKRLTQIELSAGARRFNVRGGLHWRFWRRSRPWWESFGIEESESRDTG